MVHPELGLRRAFHRATYAVRSTLMKVLGPADLPAPIDPQKQMRREHEVQEAQDDAAERRAETEDAIEDLKEE